MSKNGKYIVVCGGVMSGCGKGVASASLSLLLKLRGHDVTMLKLDPYLNIDAGILAPGEHGECYLCDDGTEADLDLGHYERIAGVTVGKDNIYTSGTIYEQLIEQQKKGKYLGQTIQVVPHVTSLVQQRMKKLAREYEIVVTEIGGTVGDLESGAFYEAIRQFKLKNEDVLIAMVAPILYVPTLEEFKTKPLQNSVKELQRHGLQPDILLCRTGKPLHNKLIDKVANFTGVSQERIFEAPDVKSVCDVPIDMYKRHLDDVIADLLKLPRKTCRIQKYKKLVKNQQEDSVVRIGVVGKYENFKEAYISLCEAIKHAALHEGVTAEIISINAEGDLREVSKDNLEGIIIPGGFDIRGTEGKIEAIRIARETGIPFLGICLGLQCSVIEFSRNVLGIENATSEEFDINAEHKVVHLIEDQKDVKSKVATMRLGAYDCQLTKGSLANELYGKINISERHRHRFEVNEEYADQLESSGFLVSGRNPQSGLVEIMELDRNLHPFFIATQAHPEFKSSLQTPAPLFSGLIRAASTHLIREK